MLKMMYLNSRRVFVAGLNIMVEPNFGLFNKKSNISLEMIEKPTKEHR